MQTTTKEMRLRASGHQAGTSQLDLTLHTASPETVRSKVNIE